MSMVAVQSSAEFGSVAASRGSALFSRRERAGRRLPERVLDMVNEVLVEARIEIAQIQGIAYGAGPGSFTGLRIAAGGAQGPPLAPRNGGVGIGALLALADETAGETAQEAAGPPVPPPPSPPNRQLRTHPSPRPGV